MALCLSPYSASKLLEQGQLFVRLVQSFLPQQYHQGHADFHKLKDIIETRLGLDYKALGKDSWSALLEGRG